MMTHEELLAQAEELADMIMQSPEVVAYKQAQQRVADCPEAQKLMNRLKEVQEQTADFSARHVPERYYQPLSQESESLLAELEKIPEVKAYQSAQSTVNDLLKDISDCLALAVARQIAPESKSRVGEEN